MILSLLQSDALKFQPNFAEAHEYFSDDKVNHSQQVLFAQRRNSDVTAWNCHWGISGCLGSGGQAGLIGAD